MESFPPSGNVIFPSPKKQKKSQTKILSVQIMLKLHGGPLLQLELLSATKPESRLHYFGR